MSQNLLLAEEDAGKRAAKIAVDFLSQAKRMQKEMNLKCFEKDRASVKYEEYIKRHGIQRETYSTYALNAFTYKHDTSKVIMVFLN